MNLKAIMAATSAALMLTACGPDEDKNEIASQVDSTQEIEVLSSYDLPHGKAIEYVSPFDPDVVTIIIDGMKASGVSIIPSSDNTGEPMLLGQFSTSVGSVSEFIPASNQDVVCKYVDSTHSGALDCYIPD